MLDRDLGWLDLGRLDRIGRLDRLRHDVICASTLTTTGDLAQLIICQLTHNILLFLDGNQGNQSLTQIGAPLHAPHQTTANGGGASAVSCLKSQQHKSARSGLE